ncbi:unnamed protein product [Didymodactylos carnosus]|uniref:Transposase n=1 Tax=Didymodactylos carnosus TaxID=1234261 RepID=A0A815NVG9_9BILA|nr:unnamed protein product [Didymodactylos carnosus]CAF1443018.1 unnamed protein product [Didymodactylos carnosus]CAF4238971.1 unnamed protein product [Didymodactylos carnosus]CAF4315731.1 unnamed protein product [Didymodactylos carnosus]
MAIPTDNREFYKILNDDNLLSEFVRDQSFAQKSEDHTCHCGSSMVDGARKKKLKDGTVKVYPTIRCTNRQCRNQLSVRKNTFFSFTDALDRPNSKLDIRTILKLIWLWCLGTSSSTISTLVHVTQTTVVDWTKFLREVCQEKLNDAPQMGGIGEVVQIDESLVRGKRKYNRGRLLLGNRKNTTAANNNDNNNNNNGLVQYSSCSSSDDSDSSSDQAQANNNRNYELTTS